MTASHFLICMQTVLAILFVFFMAPVFTMFGTFIMVICHVMTADQAIAAFHAVQDFHLHVLGFQLFPIR